MTYWALKQRVLHVWHSQVVTRLIGILFVIMIFLTILTLNQRKQIQEVRTVVEKQQETVIRAQCSRFDPDPSGCRALLQRLLRNATPAQRLELRGPRGPRGKTGSRGPRGKAGPPGARGATGTRGDLGARGLRGFTGAQGGRGAASSVPGPIGPIGPPGPGGGNLPGL